MFLAILLRGESAGLTSLVVSAPGAEGGLVIVSLFAIVAAIVLIVRVIIGEGNSLLV